MYANRREWEIPKPVSGLFEQIGVHWRLIFCKSCPVKSIAYYITAHGYGHGTRSCDVLLALHRLRPQLPVIVTTDLPQDFFDSRLANCPHLTFRKGAFDVGLVQKDSIRADLDATLAELESLYARETERVDGEQRFLEERGVGLVVADIPAMPLEAAQRAGIPNLAVGNFSWDWIYEAYAPQNPRWGFFVRRFRSVYENPGLLLRLPFAPPMEQFPRRKDLPLLATPGTPCRIKIRDAGFGMRDVPPPEMDKPWVLLSFTSIELDAAALANLDALCDDYEFFCVHPLALPGSCIRSIDRREIPFADAIASCDIVVSKPGFGLVSDCIVNRKPLVCTSRGDFAETPYLVEGIKQYLRNVHIPSEQLYRGELADALLKIRSAPEPAGRPETGGADLAAAEIIRAAGC